MMMVFFDGISALLQRPQHIPYPTHLPTPSLPTALLPLLLLRKRNRTILCIPPPPLFIRIRRNQLLHFLLHIIRSSNIHRRICIIRRLATEHKLSMAKIMSTSRRAPQVLGIQSSSRHTTRRRRKRSWDQLYRFRLIPRKRDRPLPFLFSPTPESAAPAPPIISFG